MKLLLILFLSLVRVPFAFVFFYLLKIGGLEKALFVAILAGLTDKLDGTLARKFGLHGRLLGRALDPVADRIFIIIALLSLMLTVLADILLIRYFILIIVIQEFILIPIAIFLFIHKKILISPYFGKIATFVQYLFIILAVLYGMSYIEEVWIKISGFLMVFLNVASGIHHLLCWFRLMRGWCGGNRIP